MVKIADRASYLMTDESKVYSAVGKEFAGHGSVNHSAGEYVRGTFWHTNTVESHFALLKCGIYGTFLNISEAHLHRYLAEFDFRANARTISDADRAAALLVGTKGKRLVYRQAGAAWDRSAEGRRFRPVAGFSGAGVRFSWPRSRVGRGWEGVFRRRRNSLSRSCSDFGAAFMGT